MKAAIAKVPDDKALQDLGRATFRIVHDLKNQLNGLKLYATFLRKRLERDNSSPEESETIRKLIAGIDRAARDITALVRYAQPLEVRRQPQTDLRKIILGAATQRGSGPLGEPLRCAVDEGTFTGTFDPHVMAEAFGALTSEALASVAHQEAALSIHARRAWANESPEVLIEWRGLRPRAQEPTFEGGSVYTAFAARVIAAHDGKFEITPDTIWVSLPLSK